MPHRAAHSVASSSTTHRGAHSVASSSTDSGLFISILLFIVIVVSISIAIYRALPWVRRERQKKEEERARRLWNAHYSMMDVVHVDQMEGKEFERFLGRLFQRSGYEVLFTSTSADQGADLIISKDNIKTAVQAKRYSGSVGNKAIQEVISAKGYYKCQKGIVVTNSSFTPSAIALAKSDPTITLIDRNRLIPICQECNSSAIPEFSWEEWNKIKNKVI